ncbi:eukaryotic translation initiation factor 5B isoform X1 [Poeciliopsis prolifica]|uniref:eukaryotic translation initiation factor 5B isoform X1 n=1 Tax=Poeciliopsis prolifica TaxID=188132 RepID=UPI0024145D05|nr:eukaryotic translation initiation factor 5B isoform X1 [Poeciliopsis prolifica]
MGKKQKKSGEDSAKDDGVDIDALAAEIEGAGASKEQKGKKKKKAAKREDFDEDDILKELEELSLEAQGGKAKKAETTEEVDTPEPPRPEKKKTRKGKKGGASPEDEEEEEGHVDGDKNGEQKEKNKAPPAAPPSDSDDDNSSSRSRQKAKAGKKGGKRQSASDDEEPKEAEPKREAGKEEESDEEDEEVSFRREKKKKSKGKGAKAESEEEQEDEAGGFKIKTAAQKKAEKKERDKKKKEEERMKQKKMKEKEATVEAKPEPEKKTGEAAAPPAAVDEQEGVEPAAEDENEGDKKKKDKKKKKGEKEEKKKGPSKATVKAMQEALAKMKEEEERARREEEERLRRLEELEKQREEQERLEQERREKKKQKEKERKERLKKEGKLLTKAQREARARAEATLKLLQAQGVEVPSKDSVPKKKPVYGDKRKKKPSVQSPEETSEVTSPVSETPEPVPMETESEAPAAEPEAKADADLDDWEAMASDEEKERKRRRAAELKKVHIEVKEETPAPRQPAASEEEEEEEDEEDDEEDEEEEDEEESEEEAEAEKESAPVSHGKRRAVSEEESSESDDDDGRTKEERLYDRARKRIEKRRAENLKNTDPDRLRAPVVCVLGHVDTGKTKILDKLRHTHVQDGEAGGITQQIGATNVPKETIEEQTKMVKNFDRESIRIPGMLIIDTPGHESFSNLRNRGSSLCDIAILVVDIMHGLEPQTIESINLLKEKKCPFIVALNKIDRLYDWKKSPDTDVVATLKKQKKNTKDEFDERTKAIIVEFAQQSLNAALFFENKDPRTFVSLVPTSAHSGDGMGNLIALLVELTQSMLARRLAHCDELRAQVMEVKALPGMGTTIDVILINGRLREGETIIVPGVEGPIVTQIRGLLLPPPLKKLRVKSQYEKHKEVSTSQGVKILGKDLEKTLAGLPLLVAHRDDEVPVLKDELVKELKQTLSSIKLEEKGVYVQASTLGSLEALLEFLRTSKVPYAGINIGPVHKKDVMKASTMLEHDPQYAVILAFDVKVERESQEMADSLGVRIFSAEIIYHLFDAFTKYREDYKKSKQEEFKHIAVFPVKLRVLPQFIFNSRDPIVMGVSVEAGLLKQGTPLCVPSKGFVEIGVVTSIEMNHKSVDAAKKGQEICVKIEPIPGESPKMYGRHFEATDIIVSKITRASIDALKNWFRDEMQKSDWQLIMELKKTFEII